MNGLMLHCGGKPSTREGLDAFKAPDKTDTYSPIAHLDLTNRVLQISQDLLKGYTLDRESYGVAREGNQLFALLTFKNGNEEMGLSIGYRNSYDKSMSVGFAEGNSVFVCDNLMLKGDITYMRKHTGNVWGEVEDRLISICYKATKHYEEIAVYADTLKAIELDNKKAFSIMGNLYGEGIISPRQLTIVKEQWLKPDYPDFQPRTAWSFYNANTEALKSSPPSSVMENHVNLSKYFNDNVIDI